ncbi:MAG: peptidase C1, partial [Burkholderiaceae bacterium]
MANLLVRGCDNSDVPRLRQALVKELGADAAAFGRLGIGTRMDTELEAAVRRWQSGVGLVADGAVGPHNLVVLGLRRYDALAVELSTDAVVRLFPATKPAN